MPRPAQFFGRLESRSQKTSHWVDHASSPICQFQSASKAPFLSVQFQSSRTMLWTFDRHSAALLTLTGHRLWLKQLLMCSTCIIGSLLPSMPMSIHIISPNSLASTSFHFVQWRLLVANLHVSHGLKPSSKHFKSLMNSLDSSASQYNLYSFCWISWSNHTLNRNYFWVLPLLLSNRVPLTRRKLGVGNSDTSPKFPNLTGIVLIQTTWFCARGLPCVEIQFFLDVIQVISLSSR